jgi:hypothetical protein
MAGYIAMQAGYVEEVRAGRRLLPCEAGEGDLAKRGGGGGLAMTFTRSFRDHPENAFERVIVEDVGGGNPHHLNALLGKPAVAAFIMSALAGQIMMRTVHLNCSFAAAQ